MNVTRTHEHGAEQDTRGRLRTIAKATALTGGLGFLLGVLLHPARDGAGIAAVGQLYGITHGLEAISLLLVAVSWALQRQGAHRPWRPSTRLTCPQTSQGRTSSNAAPHTATIQGDPI